MLNFPHVICSRKAHSGQSGLPAIRVAGRAGAVRSPVVAPGSRCSRERPARRGDHAFGGLWISPAACCFDTRRLTWMERDSMVGRGRWRPRQIGERRSRDWAAAPLPGCWRGSGWTMRARALPLHRVRGVLLPLLRLPGRRRHLLAVPRPGLRLLQRLLRRRNLPEQLLRRLPGSRRHLLRPQRLLLQRLRLSQRHAGLSLQLRRPLQTRC